MIRTDCYTLDNALLDFEISAEDMETLKSMKKMEDYGEHSHFPVFGGTK